MSRFRTTLTLIAALVIGMAIATPSAAQSGSQRPDGHEHADAMGGHTHARSDAYAPIGVMGDHTHAQGDWMVSYRYMHMMMKGMRDGTTSLSDAEVIDPNSYDFRITPTEMQMRMHMFGVMYAVSNDLTLMGMMNYQWSTMDHLTRAGGEFTTESYGIGDLALTALIVLQRWERQQIHANLGASFPTGSITEKDVTPASAPGEAQLPYPMQLGSGTYDGLFGLTYLGQSERWGWGGQAKGTLRFGKNDNDYTLGDRWTATVWGSRVLSSYFSVSGRLEGSTWGDVEGADPAYDTAVMMRMVPTVFPDLLGGSRLDAGIGINFFVPDGAFHNVRIAVEALLPVHQDLHGPQMESDWSGVVGVQYSF